MKHKYLNDLGISSDEVSIFNTTDIDKLGRQDRFYEERNKYGFDSRETWGLYFTAAGWLYSHLKMFLEEASEIVNLDYYKFTVPRLVEITDREDDARCYYRVEPTEMTQKEAIEMMIDYLEFTIKHCDDMDENEVRANEKAASAFETFGIVFPAMWW